MCRRSRLAGIAIVIAVASSGGGARVIPAEDSWRSLACERVGSCPMDSFQRGARKRDTETKTWRPPSFTASFRERSTKANDDRRPHGMPAVDQPLDRQIEDALELLRSVPFEELQRRGWHLQPNHYYWPLNDLDFLRKHPEVWNRGALPAEIDWDLDGQLELVRRLDRFTAELDDVPAGPPTGAGEFVWDNSEFPPADAIAYYGLLRDLRPQRVVEIGAGWSSLVLRRALTANAHSSGVTLIDPAPNWQVLGELPTGWEMIESPVQLVSMTCFEALEAGDVLFYDGSHCVHTGSDVNWIFFEVLPRLRGGVWIHVHDLGWPWDYAPTWVLDDGLSWNEQYLVQAFLMGNAGYRVRFARQVLGWLRTREIVATALGRLPGSSVWIEKLA